MNKILTIAFKELDSYFKSPIATIVLVVTLSVFNIFFYMIVEQNREATLRDMFQLMEFMFVFIVPLLTMRVFAEEKRSGTMEFLQTAPVSNGGIVLGKYLGSLIFLTVLIVLTSIYYAFMEYYGQPDKGATLIGYGGIWLEGAFFLGVGLFMSSLTRNQLVAAILTYAILFLLFFSVIFLKYVSGPYEELIRILSVWSHSESLFRGLVETKDILYFFIGLMACLGLTRLAIENKIWH